jgi:hypothetical protein
MLGLMTFPFDPIEDSGRARGRCHNVENDAAVRIIKQVGERKDQIAHPNGRDRRAIF